MQMRYNSTVRFISTRKEIDGQPINFKYKNLSYKADSLELRMYLKFVYKNYLRM